MFRPRVIPTLLLKGAGLVKTIKFTDPTYVGDPMNAVKIFNECRADELVFLDITATKEGRSPSIELVKNIGDEAFMPFAWGGGITTPDQIAAIINAGAEKVVINSAAISNPGLMREAADVFGRQSVVGSIDAKLTSNGYEAYTRGGTQPTGLDPVTLAKQMEDHGAGEIFINSIDRDGTKQGYDYTLIKSITEAVRIPVIACGGAKDPDDFKDDAEATGASALAAGTIFVFVGNQRAVLINYPDREDLADIFGGF